MIVKCERCQTRFKIPDEKVTEKGVKVRCTKCQNTFRVAREAAPGNGGLLPAPAPAGEADPFARFGAAPEPRDAEITKPGYFALGVEASRPLPSGSPQPAPWNSMDGDLDIDSGVFREPTRVGPIPLPPPARPSAGASSLPEPGARGRASDAVPLPPPARTAGASTTGLYGMAVPPAAVPATPGDGGAVPLPGRAASPGGGAGGVVPLPGASGTRGRGTAGPVGHGMPAPAPVTLFGPSKGGAPASAATQGTSSAPVPASPARPPPPPAAAFDVAAPSAVGAAPSQPRRGGAAAPGPAAPPPFALGGADPLADLLGGPGASGPPVPANAFDDLPVPRAPAAEALRRAAAPLPASAPMGAVALGPVRPVPTAAPPPAPAAPFPDDDPFASIDIDVTPAAPPAPLVALAPAAPSGPDPFESIDIADLGGASTAPAAAPGGADPFASIDAGAPHAPSRPPTSAPVGRAPAAPPPPPPSANALFDLGSDADSFGEHAGVQATDTGRAELLGTPPPPADSLGLDEAFSSARPGGSLLADVPPVDEAQEFSVTLGRVGAPGAAPREVLAPGLAANMPAVTVARPSARPEDVGIPQRRPPSRARKATALVANLVIAAALLVAVGAVGRVYLREGRVDLSVLSPEHLRALVLPPARPLMAVDVSNTLYETREGRSLFIVRGEAENRTASATRVRVRAALYDGGQRVRSAEALAGALPTPEDLYAVGSSESAAALSQRLDAAATPVAPGAKAPFLVMFHEYPADLGGFRLEVTLEPVSSASAEAGARME